MGRDSRTNHGKVLVILAIFIVAVPMALMGMYKACRGVMDIRQPPVEKAQQEPDQVTETKADKIDLSWLLVPKPEPEPVIHETLGAKALHRAYTKNELAADDEYTGKWLIVKGRVESVGKDLLGIPYVTLKPRNSVAGVQCMFSSKHKKQLASLSTGENIRVKGECQGMGVLNVILSSCTVERTDG